MTNDRGNPKFPAGYRYVSYQTIDSTIAEALRLASGGESGGLWVRAEEQTSGKGRRGRLWVSPPGNLYTTLLIEIDGGPTKLTELGFVTGIALHSTVSRLLQGADANVSLKWPNDLLINGAKASGMLLESGGSARSGLSPLAIGIGINIVSHPADPAYPTTHLGNFGTNVCADDVFHLLACEFAAWYDVWDGGRGFPNIRQEWCDRAGGFGKQIQVNTGHSAICGAFIGIADNGAMILRKADGNETHILAGDVFLQSSRGNADAQKAD